MADSLHDSLTDTHRPREQSSYQDNSIPRPRRLNLQNVGELEELAESGHGGAGMSLAGENWLHQAPPSHDTPSSEQEHNQRNAHGMDVDEDASKPLVGAANPSSPPRDELPVGAASVPYNAAALGQDQRRASKGEDQENSKDVEKRQHTENLRQENQPAGGPITGHEIDDIEHQHASTQKTFGTPSLLHADATSPPGVPSESATYVTNESTQTHTPSHDVSTAYSEPHDSTMGDGHSTSGAAMPHEGGPSITQSEAVDALEQAEQGVEVGGGYSDDGYETDSSATSQSLATSARQFIFEHGRRYHSYKADVNPYLFPNDDREQDREDLKHAMFLKLFNKTLHFAPVPEMGANVIDLGTGTGIWAVDFADLYPSASVLGIDLSPIQTVWVPPNLKFMVDDAEAEWLHPVNHFDLIHTRHTIQAFRNWPMIFERAFTHLKPGAWVECQELDHVPQCSDGTLAEDNPLLTYWLQVDAGLKALGVDFRLAPSLAGMMRAAGFTNVTERVFFTPIGPWPKNRALKEVGLYWRATLLEGIEAIALGPMIRGLGWRKEEVEVFIAGVRKAYLNKETHSWMPFYVVYGQKPYDA